MNFFYFFFSQPRVKVKFNYPIKFHEIRFYARPDHIFDQNRYRNICLFLDGIQKDCTDPGLVTKPGDQIRIKSEMPEMASEAEIRFPSKSPGVVSELEIYYTFSEGKISV